MNRHIAFLILFVIPFALFSQINAGDVPVGTQIFFPAVELNADSGMEEASAMLDIDCDELPDFRITLHKGAPFIDIPNIVRLYFLSDACQSCISTDFPYVSNLYEFGEALTCEDTYEWSSGDTITIVDWGGLLSPGPGMQDSVYFAYRKGSIEGWVNVSFDLFGESISFKINELLKTCSATSLVETSGPEKNVFYPNPTDEEFINFSLSGRIESAEVYNSHGEILARFQNPGTSIHLPSSSGVYFIRIIDQKGDIWVEQILKF